MLRSFVEYCNKEELQKEVPKECKFHPSRQLFSTKPLKTDVRNVLIDVITTNVGKLLAIHPSILSPREKNTKEEGLHEEAEEVDLLREK